MRNATCVGTQTSKAPTRVILLFIPYTVVTQLNWLSVTSTLDFKDAMMTYKCLNGLAPTYLLERFKKRSQLYNSNTRSKDMLRTVSQIRRSYKNDQNIIFFHLLFIA